MTHDLDFLDSVLVALRTRKHSELRDIGDASGVPESTVHKLFYGEVRNPRMRTVQALHNYFAGAVVNRTPREPTNV
ncbi:MAG: helix-turn-helix transcriptional regulator [Castellaniella sp.]|uniref:helix-turn-helix domain-containing protein n=1 Tax=Castellaniella sp. TaxID=1955812 RepID=UPI003C759996